MIKEFDENQAYREGDKFTQDGEAYEVCSVLDPREVATTNVCNGEYFAHGLDYSYIVVRSRYSDSINPNHYKVGGIETIDYMKAKATPEEFQGHLRLTAIKYLSRAGHKDEALQEYKKAAWYLDRLIKELEE